MIMLDHLSQMEVLKRSDLKRAALMLYNPRVREASLGSFTALSMLDSGLYIIFAVHHDLWNKLVSLEESSHLTISLLWMATTDVLLENWIESDEAGLVVTLAVDLLLADYYRKRDSNDSDDALENYSRCPVRAAVNLLIKQQGKNLSDLKNRIYLQKSLFWGLRGIGRRQYSLSSVRLLL